MQQKSCQYVTRKFGLRNLACFGSGDDVEPARTCGCVELFVEQIEGNVSIFDHRGFVAEEVVHARCACKLPHHVCEEGESLLVGAEIYASDSRRDSHHRQASKLHQVDVAVGDVRDDAVSDVLGNQTLLPERERVTSEEAILETPARSVLGVMEVDDYSTHECSALVIEALPEIAVSKCAASLAPGAKDNLSRHGSDQLPKRT